MAGRYTDELPPHYIRPLQTKVDYYIVHVDIPLHCSLWNKLNIL